MADNFDPTQFYRNAMGSGQQNINWLSGLGSKSSGINNMGDVNRTFGLKDASQIFDPLKKSLGVERGAAVNQAVKSAGNSATPGMSAVGAETPFAGAMQGLLGQQGEVNQQNQQFGAGLLNDSFGKQDQFNLGKAGLMGSLTQGQGNQAMNGMQFGADQASPNFGTWLAKIFGTTASSILPGVGLGLGQKLGKA